MFETPSQWCPAAPPEPPDRALKRLAAELAELAIPPKDPEEAHLRADAILCEVLHVLAICYGQQRSELLVKMADDFARVDKWYA